MVNLAAPNSGPAPYRSPIRHVSSRLLAIASAASVSSVGGTGRGVGSGTLQAAAPSAAASALQPPAAIGLLPMTGDPDDDVDDLVRVRKGTHASAVRALYELAPRTRFTLASLLLLPAPTARNQGHR